MLFKPRNINISIFECSDENIKHLPLESQINVLIGQFENSIYDASMLKSHFYVPSDRTDKCYFFGTISSNLMKFESDIEMIGDKSLYRLFNCKILWDVNHNFGNTKAEIDDIFPAENKSDEQSVAVKNRKINSSSADEFGVSVLAIYQLIRKNILIIKDVDPLCFSIHSYEDFRNSDNKVYPYIYQKDAGYEIVSKNLHLNSCCSAFGAKLYVAFYNDEHKRAIIDEHLDITDTKDFYQRFANLVLYKKNESVIDVLKIMGCDFVLDKLSSHISEPNFK